MPAMRWLLLLCAVLGCKRAPPPGYDVAAARSFQEDTDAKMREPTSPLSVVDAYYLGPGEHLELVASGRTATRGPGGVALAVEDAFVCASGCGEHDGSIEARVQVPLGPLTMTLAPQPVGDRPGGRVLVHDAESPALQAFAGLSWFPAAGDHIVVAQFESEPDRTVVELTTTRGLQKRFVTAGTLAFELGGKAHELTAYRMDGAPDTDPMLVPFVDATTGDSTYPVGRYVEVAPEGSVAVIDFNRATNPWCAYSEHYNCPVPPTGNRLDVAVQAGEKTYTGKH